MMNHKRILVALNPLEGHDAAFERALALAKASEAELYMLHAVPPNRPYAYRAVERLRRSTELRKRAEAAGVRAQAIEQQGDAAEIIVLHADTRPVDLVVMATERRAGWRRWRQPSVAERVLRRTKRPTLVVRDDDTGDGAAYGNILLAVDMSPGSTPLLETALQLSGAGRRLTMIHAIDGIGAAGDGWMVPEYRGDVFGAARRALAGLVPPGAGVDVTLHVAAGPAAQAIGAYAAEVGADLIVMGRSKRVMHLGSTAVRMLRNTDRALLIVPPEASAQAVGLAPFAHQRAAVAARTREVSVSSRPLIIVPADGAPETEHTVRYAVSLAKQRDAVVHAIQMVARDGALWAAPGNGTSLRARLRALRQAAEQDGVSLRIVTLGAHPSAPFRRMRGFMPRA